MTVSCFLLATGNPGDASACNVCHSKNPKMVNMHRELGYKDCFKCHLNGIKDSPEEKKLQMETDERCVRCHKNTPPRLINNP
ncbi:MAG: cytochrome C [Nitrospirae bacterium]|nr:cytochrome C [Nitrospirota bacterium]